MGKVFNVRGLIITVALGLLYFKTAEVMVQFSPRSIAGWSDATISYVWAYTAAALVEGVAWIAVRNLLNSGKDDQTRNMSWGIAIGAVIFSGLLNLIDQQITDGHLVLVADNPIANILHALVTLLPLIVAVSFMLLEIIDARNPDRPNLGQGKSVQIKTEPKHQPQPMRYPSLADPDEDQPLRLGSPAERRTPIHDASNPMKGWRPEAADLRRTGGGDKSPL